MAYLFSSESVSEGHPDKVADQISDALLDQFLAYDDHAHCAIETFCTTGQVVIMGEVRSNVYRLSEELVIWMSQRFAFIKLPDRFTTGSSIMPQKKNPDVPETARGKAGRVYGDLIAMLTLMKGTPLAYNKDFQEDKEPVFDAIDTVKDTLRAFCDMMAGVEPQADAMHHAAQAGYPTATDLADYLVRHGTPFRTAHDIVGQTVRAASERGCGLEDLPLDVLKSFSPAIEEDVYEVLKLEGSVNARNHLGGTAPAQVAKQVERWEAIISERAAKAA